jgi:GNAT superfamily N-acetyltransferase
VQSQKEKVDRQPRGMHIVDLHSVPQCIRPLARWHHRQWCAQHQDRSVGHFHTELARAPDANGLPRHWIALQGDALARADAPDDVLRTRPTARTARGELLLGSVSLLEEALDTLTAVSPWVANLWVHPAWRRRGIGSALLEHCVCAAAAAGFDTLYLHTGEYGGFYRRRGWRTLPHLEGQPPGVDVLSRALAPVPASLDHAQAAVHNARR